MKEFQEVINYIQDISVSRSAWVIKPLFVLYPEKDTEPVNIKPIVAYIILFVNVFIFLYMFFINKDMKVDTVFSKYGFVPEFAFSQPWRWISSIFLHASLGHIFFNMLFLWIFADNIEDKLGHVKFIIFYLVCGITSDIVYLFIPTFSRSVMIGASGAISGVFGGYFYLFPKSKIKLIGPFFTTMYMPAHGYLGVWFISQLFF